MSLERALARTEGRRRPWDLLADALVATSLVPLAAAVMQAFAAAGFRQWTQAGAWPMLANSLGLALSATLAALLLAGAVAACAARLGKGTGLALAGACCLPLLAPAATLAEAWRELMLRPVPLGRIMSAIGWRIDSVASAALVLGTRYFGPAAVLLTAFFYRQRQTNAAASVFRIPCLSAMLRLRLPPAMGVLAGAAALTLMLTMNDQVVAGLFLVSTYTQQMLIQAQAMLDPAAAAGLAVPFLALELALACVAFRLARRYWPAQPPSLAEPAALSAGSLLAAVPLAALVAALGAPLTVVAAQAGSASAVWASLADAGDQVRQTVVCAVAASAICASCGAVIARSWARRRAAGRISPAPLCLLNLAAPAALPALGIIRIELALPDAALPSAAPLIAAYVVRFLPVAVLVFYARWRDDPKLFDPAQRLLAIPPARRWYRLTRPPAQAPAIAAAAICAALAATELDASILLNPPGGATLGVRLYSMIHTAPKARVAALSMGIVLLALPLPLALAAMSMPWRKAWRQLFRRRACRS